MSTRLVKRDTLSLGVIGSPVTFAGQAAGVIRSLYPIFAEPRFYSSGEAMLAALAGGEIEAAVGAHASSAGGYTSFGDRLTTPGSNLYVIYEQAIPFGCCLLAKKGSRLADIEVLYGGPASLPLAKVFVAGNLPQARCEHYSSSSATVERIAAGNGREAMLGTRGLAEQAGLTLLAQNIDGEGKSGNWWVFSTQELLAPEPTTIFVTTRAADNAALGGLLGRLAAAGYGLSTIAARPTGAGLLEFDYLIRLRGTGRLTGIRAALERTAGARLAGALGES